MKSLFGCFGIILFVVGVILAFTGVGAVAGVPLIIIVVIGAKLIDGAS